MESHADRMEFYQRLQSELRRDRETLERLRRRAEDLRAEPMATFVSAVDLLSKLEKQSEWLADLLPEAEEISDQAYERIRFKATQYKDQFEASLEELKTYLKEE